MLKNLQLYTICIVIIVIILGQYTLLNNSDPLGSNDYTQNGESNNIGNNKKDGYIKGFFNLFMQSKYAEPINEIENSVNKTNKMADEFKDNIETAKKMLDIEETIDILTGSFR